MIKIGIADDHPIVREGLKLIITKIPDFTVVMESVRMARKSLKNCVRTSVDALHAVGYFHAGPKWNGYFEAAAHQMAQIAHPCF